MGYLRLYREREMGWGGVGLKTEEFNVYIIRGGCLLLLVFPPSLQDSKYYQDHRSGEARPQAPGHLVGQSQGWISRNWLEPVGGREASEGSLSLTVASNLNSKRRQRGGEGRVEQ